MIGKTAALNMHTNTTNVGKVTTPTSLILFQAFTTKDQEPSFSSSVSNESKDHISDFLLSEEKVQSGNAYDMIKPLNFEASPKKLSIGTARPGQRITLGEPEESSS